MQVRGSSAIPDDNSHQCSAILEKDTIQSSAILEKEQESHTETGLF